MKCCYLNRCPLSVGEFSPPRVNKGKHKKGIEEDKGTIWNRQGMR